MNIKKIGEIIRSDLPPIVQGYQLLTSVEHFFTKQTVGSFAETGTADVVLWLRDIAGRIMAVNQLLTTFTGISAEEFQGLTYETYCHDRHLIKQRRWTDRYALEHRQPILATELSVFGEFKTLTIPIMDDCGSVLATAHAAILCQHPDPHPVPAFSDRRKQSAVLRVGL